MKKNRKAKTEGFRYIVEFEERREDWEKIKYSVEVTSGGYLTTSQCTKCLDYIYTNSIDTKSTCESEKNRLKKCGIIGM